MARESFKATPGDRVKLQVIETDDRPMTVDLDGKLDPVMLPVDDGSNDDQPADGTTRDPAEWGNKNATDPKGVTPRVQKRFDRLKAETETERRIRIQAEQDRDEARRVAAARETEVNDLRQRLATNTSSLASSMTAERDVRIADATRRLEQAHAEGNSADIAKATADLTSASAERAMIAANTPRQQPQREQPEQRQPAPQQQQSAQAPTLSPDVVAWVSATPRFNRDVEFTKTAVAIHNLLDSKGIKPGSASYITELDKRMKAEYPDHQPYSGSSQDEGDDEDPTPAPRRTNAVAPGSRETRQPSNPRTMELSPRQVAIAKGLGLTSKEQLARYAAEIQKREPNGSSA